MVQAGSMTSLLKPASILPSLKATVPEAALPRKKAPALVVELGRLLSWLDGAGSCWWGCANGDHLTSVFR